LEYPARHTQASGFTLLSLVAESYQLFFVRLLEKLVMVNSFPLVEGKR